MKKKKINERFQYFSIVLNVRKGKNVNWGSLTNDKIVENIVRLKFLTPMELGAFFKNFEGIAQNSNVGKSRIRRFRFERFLGQLEKGSENGRPHYNLSIMTSCKVLTSTVIRELSLALYSVKTCNSINVEPTHDVESLEKYCLKSEFNALLAPQLAAPERWIAAFIDQLEQYLELNKVYPTTIIIDITRNENNANVEALYSTIENIKNSRVDSTLLWTI